MNGMTPPPASAPSPEDWQLGPNVPQSHRAWLRALGRRLAALADMRADLDRGDDIAGVMKRHRVFWKEEKATAAALRQWTPAMIATAIDRARAAERAVMAPGNAGDVLAEHAVLGLARRR